MKIPKSGRKVVKMGKICIKLIVLIFTRENSSHPPPIFLNEVLYAKTWSFLFDGTLFSLLVETTNVVVYFFFQTKLNKEFHNTWKSNFPIPCMVAHD